LLCFSKIIETPLFILKIAFTKYALFDFAISIFA